MGAEASMLPRARTGAAPSSWPSSVLERAGLRVVARNWRRPEGELDIVRGRRRRLRLRRGPVAHGLERGHPLESITPAKQAQVIRAARLYLAEVPTPATALPVRRRGRHLRPGGASPPEIAYIPTPSRSLKAP
jgi:putative endonuclease